MKKNYYFLSMIGMLLCAETSCQDSDGKCDDQIIIDPIGAPMFQFDEDGVPYRWETPTLSHEMQASISDEFVGYGWKWMQTHEIDTIGNVNPQAFYGNIYGISPLSYYFESDTLFYSYYHSDAANKDGYQFDNYTIDMNSGSISNGGKPFGRDGGDVYFRIWSIFHLSGHWYMECVEPLCTRYNEIGLPHTVWGVSQYVRMNDAELKQMQRQYAYYLGYQCDSDSDNNR